MTDLAEIAVGVPVLSQGAADRGQNPQTTGLRADGGGD